jgi:FHA domain
MTATPNAAATSAVPEADDASLSSALSTVDTQATQRLTTVGLVYQARQTRLARNAASIAAQQGAGSAQATAAEAAVTAAKMTAARLAVVRQQVSTAAPTVAASGWALHGRVYTAQLAPAAGYCVFLVDAQNAYYSPAGFAYTDSTGYFQLTYPGTATESGTPAGEAPPDAAVQPPTLYVEITNPHGQPVHLSTTALAPTPGTAPYQTFSLSASEQPIGDPPSEVRATALPPQSRRGTEPVTLTAPTVPAPAEPAAPESAAPAAPTPAEPAAPESAAPAAPVPAKPADPDEVSPTVPTEVVPAVPATPPLRVRVTNSVDESRSFALDSGELIIGREKGSAIQLRGRGVSKNHALLRVHGEDVTIEDLRSTNGTKVNGVAIDRQTALVPGDLINVGGVQLVVEYNQVTSPDES